jgi:hypothetical protein
METQSKESRNLEAHCKGGQGPPRAVAPSKKNYGSTALLEPCSIRGGTVPAFLNVPCETGVSNEG